MAWFCETNKSTGSFFAKSNVEAEVELTFQEAHVLSGSHTIQASINEGHNFISCIDEFAYPSPAFIIGVCLGNLIVAYHSRFGFCGLGLRVRQCF